MPFYESKPLMIEAIQYTGENIQEVIDFTLGKASIRIMNEAPCAVIETLEGLMLIPEGSYIIRETSGNYSVCLEKIFEQKYFLAKGAINS